MLSFTSRASVCRCRLTSRGPRYTSLQEERGGQSVHVLLCRNRHPLLYLSLLKQRFLPHYRLGTAIAGHCQWLTRSQTPKGLWERGGTRCDLKIDLVPSISVRMSGESSGEEGALQIDVGEPEEAPKGGKTKRERVVWRPGDVVWAKVLGFHFWPAKVK